MEDWREDGEQMSGEEEKMRGREVGEQGEMEPLQVLQSQLS